MARILLPLILLLWCLTVPRPAAAADSVPAALPVDASQADFSPVFQPDLTSFRNWPVLHEGRLKPMDSFARVIVTIFSGRETVRDAQGLEIGASGFMAALLFRPDMAADYQVFYVPNQDVLVMLGVKEGAARKYWSFRELFMPVRRSLGLIEGLTNREQNGQNLTKAQKGVLDLYGKTILYLELSKSLSLFGPDFILSEKDNADKLGVVAQQPFSYVEMLQVKDRYLSLVAPLLKEERTKRGNWTAQELDLLALGDVMRRKEQERQVAILRIVPAEAAGQGHIWVAPWRVWEEGLGTPANAVLFDIIDQMVQKAQNGDEAEWSRLSRQYLAHVQDISGAETGGHGRVFDYELFYNKAHLFHWSLGLYIGAFLLGLCGLIFTRTALWRIGACVMAAGLVPHVAGVALRMLIMGRPPVATLYESIVFVGLVAVLSALLLERRLKNGQSLVMGAFLGGALQFVGLRFAMNGDTMGMLVAVLNTNFWLSTHVVTITIGYGTSLICGAAAHWAAIGMALRKIKGGDIRSDAYARRVVTALALVALFFTALGTILGGIWADQSWGRFWGWDPKENGALLIVLWLTFLLHGRIGGILQDRAYILCGMVTCPIVAVAWFGVNFLSVGLHSYGFSDRLAEVLGGFLALEGVLIGGLAVFLIFTGARRMKKEHENEDFRAG